MEYRSHDSDLPGHCGELPEVLRAAVLQVRDEAVPTEVAARAVARAAAIVPRPYRTKSLPARFNLIALTAIAAALLLFLGLRGTNPLPRADKQSPFSGNSQALHVRPAGIHVIVAAPTGHDVLPLGMNQLAGNWSDWDRGRALYDLAQARRGTVEAYIRHTPTSWKRAERSLSVARIVAPEGPMSLLGVYIQVNIEGPRARTLVDHIFRNPANQMQSGTFEYSLPEGGSLSHFTLLPGNQGQPLTYVSPTREKLVTLPDPERFVEHISASGCWGQPHQATVVRAPTKSNTIQVAAPKQAMAMAVAETERIDVRAPVRRIGPNALFRVVLAYEQTLPIVNGKLVYTCPLPKQKLNNLAFYLQADNSLADSAELKLPGAKFRRADGKTIWSRSWQNVTDPGTVHFEATPQMPNLQVATGREADSGTYYAFARLRPNIPAGVETPVFARHAIFLLDTSLSVNTDLFSRRMKLMREVLEKDTDITHFNVLAFSTGGVWLSPKGWFANNKEGRERAQSLLDGVVLEGAANLSAALDAAARPAWAISDGLPIHAFLLSDGRPSWGEAKASALAARFEAKCLRPMRVHCYHTERGAENDELFAMLTRRGGGVYKLENEGSALAHRQQCLLVERLGFEDGPTASDVLVAGRRAVIPPGGEVIVAARFGRPGQTKLVLQGTLGGKPVVEQHEIQVSGRGELAARAWGEMAVSSLVEVSDPAIESLAVACGKRFRVASNVTSFAFTHGDEVLPATSGVALALEQGWERQKRDEPDGLRERVRSVLLASVPTESARDAVQLFHLMTPADFSLPPCQPTGGIVYKGTVPKEYLAQGATELVLLDESSRRAASKDTAGAVRVVSGLMVRNPERSTTIRLVGSRLIGLGDSESAAQLLLHQAEREPSDAATHRMLALSLARTGRPAWAALHYEAALAQLGSAGESSRAVRAEYAGVLCGVRPANKVGEYFASRQAKIVGKTQPADLRVSLTWNTPTTSVELDVVGPDEKPAASGIWLTKDREGPRVYEVRKLTEGAHRVEVRLAEANPEAARETLAVVEVVRDAGGEGERRVVHLVLLRQAGQSVRIPVR